MSSSEPKDPGEEFLKKLTWPEEDRALFTDAKWDVGTFRWFRSPNITPIEQWRKRKTEPNEK